MYLVTSVFVLDNGADKTFIIAIAVGVGAPCIAVVIIVIVMAILFYRYKMKTRNRKFHKFRKNYAAMFQITTSWHRNFNV